MKTQFGRITGLTLASLMLLASPFADAATPLPKPERSLLGVRLMSTFKDVLKKFGQPDEIQIGSPAPPQKADLNAQRSASNAGGVSGRAGGFGSPGGSMGGRGGGGSMGGMMGMPPGMAGMGGSMGMMGGGGAPQMGGRMGGGKMSGMGGSMGGGRLPGFAGGGQRGKDPDNDLGGGGGLPGFPGAGGSMGGMMPGAPGMGAGAGATEEATGESTWWYHVKGSKGQTIGLHYSFLFNKEGKVIQIQQYGYTGGGKTLQGVGLGSSLGQVLGKYGMSNEGNRAGEMAKFTYGGNEQVVFQLLRNRVIGVTLAVTQ